MCKGVEGPDSSEEALHWASRGDRGSVLCPLEPSLQVGSGDSETGEKISVNGSLFFSLAQLLPTHGIPLDIPTRGSSPVEAKGPVEARCPGSGYLSLPSSEGIS